MLSARFMMATAALLTAFQASAEPPIDCKVGLESIEHQQYKDAIAPLSRCLSLNLKAEPRALILSARAYAYGEEKQFEQAVADQKAFIDLQKPKDSWPLIMLGVYYRELKQYDKSLEALKSAGEYDEDGPGTGPGMAVYYHTAQTLHQAGRYEEAIEACTKGIPKQPDYGYALYQRALSYEALGIRDQAKRDLFRAFELMPKDGYEPEIAAKLNEYGFKAKVRTQ